MNEVAAVTLGRLSALPEELHNPVLKPGPVEPAALKVLKYLRSLGAKGLTYRDAMVDFGLSGGALTGAITRLRSAGYHVLTVFEEHAVTGDKFHRYVLVDEPNV